MLITAVPRGGSDSSRPLRANEQAWGFAAVSTRMLLVNDGHTTPLLSAAALAPLRVAVSGLSVLAAGALDERVREALGLAADRACLVRRSRLELPSGQVASDNEVIASVGVDPRVDAVLRDEGALLGEALVAAGVRLERRPLEILVDVWPVDGAPCVGKSYLLCRDGAPLVYIRELYSPVLFPAAGHAAPAQVGGVR
jgi:hypothetical protein